MRAFFREKRELLAGSGVILAVFGFTFAVSDLDMAYFLAGMQAVIFLLILYLCADAVFFRERVNSAKENERLRRQIQTLRMERLSAEKEREEYFLMWLHQIKTPITAAKLLVKEQDIDLKSQLFYIENYSDMAMSFVKLGSPGADMDIAPVHMDLLIRPLLRRYALLFIQKKIRLEYEEISETVISDARWLSILIEQLLSNAVKYTKEGTVSIGFDKENQSLWIQDTGSGIPSEDLPKIFDKGYSGFNGRLNQKSSGLGLYLARQIAARLSIEIKAESEAGSGSRFSLIFRTRQEDMD